MPDSPPHRPHPLLLLLPLLGITACLPQDPSSSVPVLEERIRGLEAELKSTRSTSESAHSLLNLRLADLEQRLEETEAARDQYRKELASRSDESSLNLRRLERTVGILNDAILSGQRATGFSITRQGHFPAQTRYGTFLMELKGYDKTDAGYDLHLQIANATGFKVFQYDLRGDFGRKSPELPPEASYQQNIEAIDAWEATLTQFQHPVRSPLEPGLWTPVVLRLPAKRLIDLEFIRVWLDVRQVALSRPAASGQLTTFDATQSELSVLQSDYGTFYLKMEKTTAVAGGHEVVFRFGNPLGLTINQLRFSGTLGPKPPASSPDKSPDQQQLDLLRWRQSLRPYSVEFSEPIKPTQWTKLTMKLPARKAEELKHIECRVELLQVQLRSN